MKCYTCGQPGTLRPEIAPCEFILYGNCPASIFSTSPCLAYAFLCRSIPPSPHRTRVCIILSILYFVANLSSRRGRDFMSLM